MRLPRLLRGILGTALTWGIASAPLSAAFMGIVALFGVAVPADFIIQILIRSAIAGALNGAAFAGALAILGRRKTPETLSARVLIACGAVGGAFFPAMMMGLVFTLKSDAIPPLAVLWSLGSGALIGSAFAGLTLKAIRHSSRLNAQSRDAPILQRQADPV